MLAHTFIVWCKEEENMKKSNDFQELVSQELLRLLLSNLVCEVLYMKTLKFVEFGRIRTYVGAIVFEL